MKLVKNRKRYDDLQNLVITEIVESIKGNLESRSIPRDAVRDLAGDIALAVAAVIDGARVMEHGGRAVRPVLTFEEPEGTLITAGRSSLHEYVFGVVEQVYDAED